MTLAKTGYGGEFHLHDGTALTELVEVVSFSLPNEEREVVEATHLKSPGRRREYISGMSDGGEMEVVLNYVPGSETDLLILAALASNDPRAFSAEIPRNAAPNWVISGTCIVTGYDRGSVEADGKMEATMTVRLTGATTEAAAA